MTRVTDTQVATLRTQLAQDFEEHQRLLASLDMSGKDKAPYLTLVGAGFITAVERHFSQAPTFDDVVEYVADVRSRSEEAAQAVDARVAERLIWGVYEQDPSFDDVDASSFRQTQVLLLVALITDEQLDDAQLDDFMSSIRTVADKSLS